MEVKLRVGVHKVVAVFVHFDVFEDVQHLLDEIDAEDSFAEPELLVLGQNDIMDIVRNLRHQGHCRGLRRIQVLNPAIGVQLGKLFRTYIDRLGIVHHIVDLGHIVELDSVVDEYIGILHLRFELPHGFDQSLIYLAVVLALHLGDAAGQIVIISTIGLLWDL